MRIIRQLQPSPTPIEKFADEHDLTMRIVERDKEMGILSGARFYAQFQDAEISEGSMLVGAYGNGNSESEAIAAYAREISGKILVIRAYGDDRREIKVPTLEGA